MGLQGRRGLPCSALASTAARWMACSSSRTLPGQSWRSSSCSACGWIRSCSSPRPSRQRSQSNRPAGECRLGAPAVPGRGSETRSAGGRGRPETALDHRLFQIPVGGRQDAHIHLEGVSSPIRCRSPYCSTRSSLACSARESSPISSRNRVPLSASSNSARPIVDGAGEGPFT